MLIAHEACEWVSVCIYMCVYVFDRERNHKSARKRVYSSTLFHFQWNDSKFEC